MFRIFEGKPDHPMFSVAEAQRLLEDLPRNNYFKALDEITAWLESVRDATGFTPEVHSEVIMLLDENGQPFYNELLQLYLGEPHLQDFEGQKLWLVLHAFMKALASAYEVCLLEIHKVAKVSAGLKDHLPVICVRSMRAVTEQIKIELMHYIDIEQTAWDRLYASYDFAVSNQFAETLVFAYPRQALRISPQRELLRAMVLYISSPMTLAQDQIEVCFRIATRMASFFDLNDAPAPNLPFCFDLSRPGPPQHVTPDLKTTPAMRYFGTTRAVPKVSEIIMQHVYGTIQQEQRFGSEFTPEGKLTVLKHLQIYWGQEHPHRRQERRSIHSNIEVVHSFVTISKLVTHMDIDNAENISEKDAEKLKSQSNINLAATEEIIDYVTEKWSVSDLSLNGIGCMIPKGAGLWVKIGDLVGLKAEHSPVWWVGVIRRLHTDATGVVHAGIEILAKKPLSVWVRTLGRGTEKVAAWESSSGSFDYDYLSVILLPDVNNSYANATMLMLTGGYVPDTIYEVMLGEKSRNIRLTGLMAEGEDFEQITFKWLN